MRANQRFWSWLRENQFSWLRRYHLSKADWFGAIGVILLFGGSVGPILLAIAEKAAWPLLAFPLGLLGYLSLNYAVYLEQIPIIGEIPEGRRKTTNEGLNLLRR